MGLNAAEMTGQGCDTATAALRLGWSRERVVRALLTGRLRGRQVYGRWCVDVGSVEQLRRESTPPRCPEPAPTA